MNLTQNAEFLHKYAEETDLQSGETRLPHWSKMCQETRVSDQNTSRCQGKIKTVKLSVALYISCLMSEI